MKNINNPINVDLHESQIVEDYTEIRERLMFARALNYVLIFIIAILIAILTLFVNRGSHFSSNHEPYTDSWCVEYTHYMHPTWSAEQCEDFVFMNTEMFNNKYNN